MPAPFGKDAALTLRRFIETAAESYDVQERTINEVFYEPAGEVRPRFLVRELESGAELAVPITDIDDDEILNWHFAEHLCRRLAMETSHFGFWFDDDGLHFVNHQ